VFGQLFTQLRGVDWRDLRGKPNAQVWSVAFLGEGSIDVGGPYRESLTNAVADLQSENVPLFILCPNGKNSVGLNREKWIPNPSQTSSTCLKMYEFVGVLIGIALRTKQTLGFDFSSILWKKLLNREPNLEDLEAIDKLCCQALNELEKVDAQKFDLVCSEMFQTQLSDGSEIELKKNGKKIRVTKENLTEFASLVTKNRLQESDQQIKAIQKGLDVMVPLKMLSLFSWFDLETLVCGSPDIDIELLRKNTKYCGLSSSAAVVKYFWKALSSFSSEERQLFLRFVWGRNRLPVAENEWSSQFTINALSVDPENLPIAHTCFFSLDLPPYENLDQCREKLRYAIYNCQAIDVDFNPSSSLQAWIED
jgi:hypothetical protein